MKVLILAAGYGTRLYPHTKNFAKPLLRLNKKPVIDYILDKVSRISALSKIIVVTNSRFFKNFQKWKNDSCFKDKIILVNDLTKSPADKLGAIADMYLGIKSQGLNEDYLVIGGDNFWEESLEDFVRFAKNKKPYVAIGLADVGAKTEASHYGVAILNRKQQILDFEEKPVNPKSTLAAMCLYYFPRQKLKLLKKCINSSRLCFDNLGAYISWLTKHDLVYGFIFKKMWFDIGRIQTYRKLNNILKLRS
jgi:glucose-1-phosphate thymidylyltransferase